MPIKDNMYTDPDAIEALYQDPESEALLVAYALETGGIMTGAVAQVTATSAGSDTIAADEGGGGGEVIYRPTSRIYTKYGGYDPFDDGPES